MSTSKKLFDSLDQPAARRYLTIATVLALVLGVLAVSSRSGTQDGARTARSAAAEKGTDQPASAEESTPTSTLPPLGAVEPAKPGSVSRVSGSRPVAAGAKASGAATGSAAKSASVSAPGVTDTEIKIGVSYDKSAGALNTAYGFAGVGQIDGKRAQQALIDYINKNGGVAGRKLKPVWYETDQTDGRSLDTVYQAMCAAFTQDNRVFATVIGGNDNFKACMHKYGVVQVTSGAGLSDSQTFKQFPNVVAVSGILLDRLARVYANQMVDRGFFKTDRDGGTTPYKLGVVSYDDQVFTRTIAALKDALAKRGITLTDVVQVKRFQAAQEIADEANATRAAALKFKTDGITHVMFLSTSNAFQQLTFMQASEKQLYRPRYGLTSNDGGQAIATLLGGDSREQLKNAISVGWFPFFDVPESDYTPASEFPAMKRCRKILMDAGETYGSGDPTRNKDASSAITCDSFFYLDASLEAAGSVLTPQTWLEGVAKVGRLDIASSFVADTSDRHDGLGAVRDVAFFQDCNCYHYTSGVRAL